MHSASGAVSTVHLSGHYIWGPDALCWLLIDAFVQIVTKLLI